MKKYIICFVVFILIFLPIKSYCNKGTFALTNLFGFDNTRLDAQNKKDYEEEIGENLYHILTERTRIMQDVAFGLISLEVGKVQLENLLEDPLLKIDLNYLRQVLEYPTDIEEIIAMKMGPIQNLVKHENDSILQFSSEIVWTIKDMDQVNEMEITYTFELIETSSGVYKLKNYYLIQ